MPDRRDSARHSRRHPPQVEVGASMHQLAQRIDGRLDDLRRLLEHSAREPTEPTDQLRRLLLDLEIHWTQLRAKLNATDGD